MQNLRDSTFLDATLQLITVANSCRRSHRITMQSVSKLFPCLLYPIMCPTTIVPFDSNGGQENVVKLGDLPGLSWCYVWSSIEHHYTHCIQHMCHYDTVHIWFVKTMRKIHRDLDIIILVHLKHILDFKVLDCRNNGEKNIKGWPTFQQHSARDGTQHGPRPGHCERSDEFVDHLLVPGGGPQLHCLLAAATRIRDL